MATTKLINCTIYGLTSSNKPNDIRYIGQTTKTLKKRLIGHRASSKRRNSPVACWIRKHEKIGNKILIHKLQVGIWNDTEEDILSICKDSGYKLLNCTDGGDGTLGHTWKLSEKSKSNISNGHKGLKLSEEHKANISKGNKGKKRSAKVIKQMSIRNKGNQPKGGLQKGDTHTLEARLKISLTHKGKNKSKEHKEKLRLAALRRWEKERELKNGYN